jgi:hypothetical protein
MKNHIYILLVCLLGTLLLVERDLYAQQPLVKSMRATVKKHPQREHFQQESRSDYRSTQNNTRSDALLDFDKALSGDNRLLYLPTGETLRTIPDQIQEETAANIFWGSNLAEQGGVVLVESCGEAFRVVKYFSRTEQPNSDGSNGINAANGRMQRQNTSTQAAFGVAPTLITLTSKESLAKNEIGFATATEEIILSSGFIASVNSELRLVVAKPACDHPLSTARIGRNPGESPEELRVALSAHPNPFINRATLSFKVTGQKAQRVSLQVYDMQGKPVARLYAGEANSGENYSVEFSPPSLQAGIYIVKLLVANKVSQLKLVLVR